MSRIIVDEERHVRDGRDGGRWETVVGVRDILAQAVSRPTFVPTLLPPFDLLHCNP